MKHITPFCACLFVLYIGFSSCSFSLAPGITGNGRLINQEIAVTDYTAIELNNTANVIYEQKSAKAPYLQVYIDENLMPELDIKVVQNRLIIASKDGKNLTPTQFKIYTNSKNISNVQSNGTGALHLKGEVNAPRMEIDIHGTGDVVSDSLYCEQLKVNITGTGDSRLAGVTDDATFEISGTGDIEASDYFTQRLQAVLSGTGDMNVRVSEQLNAAISGTGDIRYAGNPKKISESISGTGRLIRR